MDWLPELSVTPSGAGRAAALSGRGAAVAGAVRGGVAARRRVTAAALT